MNNSKNKQERLVMVLDILRKLKRFPTSETSGSYIDLYSSDLYNMEELKQKFSLFVNQDDTQQDTLKSIRAQIEFPEVDRLITFYLPIEKSLDPIVKLKVIT